MTRDRLLTITAVIALGLGLAAIVATGNPRMGLGLPAALPLGLAWLPLLILCGFMVAKGRPRRLGDSWHCRRCDYHVVPQAPTGERCPECGADWRSPEATVKGRLVYNRAMFWSGLVALVGIPVFNVAWVLLSQSSNVLARGVQSTLLTNTALVDEVVRQETWPEGWAELAKRRLDAADAIKLATGLIDARLERGYQADMERPLFRKIVGCGVLTPDLIDRYYREMFDVWIIGPDHARVGEPVSLAIGTLTRFNHTADEEVTIYVAGYRVDDSPHWLSGREQPVYASQLGKQCWHLGRDYGPYDSPEVTITPSEPGALSVSFAAWMVVHSERLVPGVMTWKDNGSPDFPRGIYWSGWLEVEHVIEVVAAED